MCYNCGCGVPEDDMGKGKIQNGGGALTEDDFSFVAKKWNMSKEEAKEETYKLLKKQFEKK